MEMMKSVRGGLPDDEDDDEEDYVKTEGSSQKGETGGKVDAKGNDQKPATPRSKHSATEQRRRSKINDRFQILRELIPHSDQKRDKASFLLEVIEYIQFLQEKVHKYETAFPGWNHDNVKLMQWNKKNIMVSEDPMMTCSLQKSSQGPGETMAEHGRVIKNGPGPGLMFPGKFDNNSLAVPAAILTASQNPLESDIGTGLPYKPADQHRPVASKGVTAPLHPQQQQNIFPSSVVRVSGGLAQPPQRLMTDEDNMAAAWQRQSTPVSDLTEQEELMIEGGTIRMSSVYCQGLLSSLTHALQSSGIDLSQANVSVQIDVGKRAVRPAAASSSAKDHEEPSSSNRALTHSRVASSGEDSDPAQKRLRMDNS